MRILIWLLLKGHERIVELLIKKGSNYNHCTPEGLTAAKIAANKGHDRLAKYLKFVQSPGILEGPLQVNKLLNSRHTC